MRVLIVGAGAVGVVYGYHLAKGGAEVTYLVRDKYRADVEKGMPVYALGLTGRVRRDDFADYACASAFDELVGRHFDYVILSFDSTALQAAWLKSLAEAVNDDAIIVLLQPDIHDREKLLPYFDDARILQGLIGFIAFQAPLHGAPAPLSVDDDAGIAFLLPPVAGFFAAQAAARPLQAALSHGGFRSATRRNMADMSASASARFIPLIAGLELAGWRFDAMMKSDVLSLALKAAREANAAVRQRSAGGNGFGVSLFSMLMRVGLPLVRTFAPFDMEVYLQYHFTKVGDQTLEMLRSYARAAQGESPALRELLGRLQEQRARYNGSRHR